MNEKIDCNHAESVKETIPVKATRCVACGNIEVTFETTEPYIMRDVMEQLKKIKTKKHKVNHSPI